MTVTLLNSPPDVTDQKVRHTEKNVSLLVTPPLTDMDDLIGTMTVTER